MASTVDGITRSYSELLPQQVRTSQAGYSSPNTLATQAAQVDNLLSASSTGITSGLQSFVNALQTLSGSPSSSAARQALLSQAQALAQQLTGYDAQITQYGSTLEQQISGDVTQVNTLASDIASLNTQIANDLAGTGQAPNQLMDQRDNLIDQLSQYASVNTATEPNGALDVYIGTGQALVTGGTAQQLSTLPNQYDASRARHRHHERRRHDGRYFRDHRRGARRAADGSRTQVLDPAQNALGQISVGPRHDREPAAGRRHGPDGRPGAADVQRRGRADAREQRQHRQRHPCRDAHQPERAYER